MFLWIFAVRKLIQITQFTQTLFSSQSWVAQERQDATWVYKWDDPESKNVMQAVLWRYVQMPMSGYGCWATWPESHAHSHLCSAAHSNVAVPQQDCQDDFAISMNSLRSSTDTDSVLCAPEDHVILHSLRKISLMPPWQFRLEELRTNTNYLLTWSSTLHPACK